MTKFRNQKNIYSKFILQRILDYWGVGKIETITYFSFDAPNVWRHAIETNQGSFELFSYPHYKKDRSEKVIYESFTHAIKNQQNTIKPYYRFGRYHLLFRLTRKYKISIKQAKNDLKLLENKKIEKIFRVYGTILQIKLDDESSISSYAAWNIQKMIASQARVLVDSIVHSKNKIDEALTKIQLHRPMIDKISINKAWFEIYFTDGISLHLHQYWGFPATEINIPKRKNEIVFYDEEKIYYIKNNIGLCLTK